MIQFLLFTLAAPISSFGTVAVGERRPTWDRPSKSQIIGLIAGCLGIERNEDEKQHALVASLGFGVRIDDPGQLATDYHTTQVPPARRNRRFATRAEELAVGNTGLKTILSRREYRTGSCYTVCLWLKTNASVSLEEIDTSIVSPVFAPFAGRKANVLMFPMRPEIVEAVSIDAAFTAFDARLPSEISALWHNLQFKPKGHAQIFCDADGAHGQPVARLEERRDIPESRNKWRFGLRTEVLLGKAATTGDTP